MSPDSASSCAGHIGPTPADWEWLRRAYRTHDPAGVTVSHVTLADWQHQLLRLVSPALVAARAEARSLAGHHPRAAEATERWLDAPPVDLLRYLTGAFVLHMHAAHAAAEDAEERNRFTDHLDALADPSAALDFFAAFPLLVRFVVALCRDWAAAAAEFGGRFAVDAADLAAWLGLADAAVGRIEPGLGDRHGGGRTVARVEIGGIDVAYKPSPVDVAAWLAGCRPPASKLGVPVPDVLARDGYGWARWVDEAATVTQAEVTGHFHALGELNALAWALGATDLHAENLIAGPSGPVLVDVETLMSPRLKHDEAGHGHPAPGILLESPLNTGILPNRIRLADGVDIDASAFGSPDQTERLTVTAWADAGTSRMHSVQIPLPAPERPPQLLAATGTAVDPLAYIDDVMAGSTLAFAQLSAHADGWAAAIAAPPVPTPSVRVLLRDTSLYGRIARYLQHPAVLHDPPRAEKAFALLDPAPIHDRPGYQDAVVADERAALLRGDIPSFMVPVDGTSLVLGDGSTLPDFFAASPISRARDHFRRLGADRDALTWVTSASLRSAQLNRDRERDHAICCAVPLDGSVPDDLLAGAATTIADRLVALAQRDSGDVSWLTLRVDDRSNWRPVAADRSIYLGTVGIQLFFETMHAVGVARPTHLALLERLRDQRSRDRLPVLPGVFDGAGGEVLAELVLDHLGAPAGPRAVEQILPALSAPCDLPDLLTGSAGLVLVLGSLAQRRPDLAGPSMRVAAGHVDHLLAAAWPQSAGIAWPADGELNTGFAHGSSGIALALHDFATRTGDAGLARRSRDAVAGADAWEAALFDTAAGNWPDLRAANASLGFSTSWCNGSAGIGLARAARILAGDRSPGLRADLDRALDVTGRDGLGHGQGLCHGDAGVSEFFLAAGAATGDPVWRDRARAVAGMVATRLLDDGGIAHLDFADAVDVPGLIHGSAGVGYQLLRLIDPDRVPSILTLALVP